MVRKCTIRLFGAFHMLQTRSMAEILTTIDREITEEAIESTVPTTENRDYSLNVIRKSADDKVLVTFVEQEGYMILRITSEGKSTDLILNSDQIKLLLRQSALWLTR
jgi:hypothetical protein